MLIHHPVPSAVSMLPGSLSPGADAGELWTMAQDKSPCGQRVLSTALLPQALGSRLVP